jgi:hypothetical protein
LAFVAQYFSLAFLVCVIVFTIVKGMKRNKCFPIDYFNMQKQIREESIPPYLPSLTFTPPQKTQSISKQIMKTDFYQPVTFFCEEKVLAVTNA